MPHVSKDVDWKEIERRYRQGETIGEIARDYVSESGETITRQAIGQRRDKEHWTLPPKTIADAELWLSLASEFTELERNHHYTPIVVANALAAYAKGGNHRVAAGLVGISENAWKKRILSIWNRQQWSSN